MKNRIRKYVAAFFAGGLLLAAGLSALHSARAADQPPAKVAKSMGLVIDDHALARDAVARGITVVQCTRAGSGRTFRGKRPREYGFLIADNLTPQKARLLLALALTVSDDPTEITRMFATY